MVLRIVIEGQFPLLDCSAFLEEVKSTEFWLSTEDARMSCVIVNHHEAPPPEVFYFGKGLDFDGEETLEVVGEVQFDLSAGPHSAKQSHGLFVAANGKHDVGEGDFSVFFGLLVPQVGDEELSAHLPLVEVSFFDMFSEGDVIEFSLDGDRVTITFVFAAQVDRE